METSKQAGAVDFHLTLTRSGGEVRVDKNTRGWQIQSDSQGGTRERGANSEAEEGMRKEKMQENIDANHVEWGFTEGWSANI